MDSLYWKVEILTGTYPAKTKSFKNDKMRLEIMALFDKIGNIYFVRITKREVIKALSITKYEADNIADCVSKLYREQNKKIDLIFIKNSKFKFDVISEKNEITIKTPSDDMFF